MNRFVGFLLAVYAVLLPHAECLIVDASLWNNGSLPFITVFQYNNVTENSEQQKQACYHKESRVAESFEESEGKFLNIAFQNLKTAELSVEDNYSSKKHTIPVLLKTKWLSINNTNYEQLIQAFEESTVLNISFYTTVIPNAATKCKGSNNVVVDVKWCKWAQVFTHHKEKINGLPQFDTDGSCIIDRNDQAQHFMNMWNTGNNKDFEKRCSERSENCKDAKNCKDLVYFANAKGYIKDMNMKKLEDDEFEVNMIIHFDYWTEEFPEMFTNSHKKCLYYGNISQLVITFFLQDHSDRKVPAQFFAFVLIACALGLIMAIALTLVVCTCSRQSFRMELWEYWVKRNAYRKYAKEHASEIAEQVADKRMEKQEALMTNMLAEMGTE